MTNTFRFNDSRRILNARMNQLYGKRIVIWKSMKRAQAQMEYKVHFIDEKGKIAHETVVFGHDLKYIDKAYKKSWIGAPVHRTWLNTTTVVDKLNEKEADCLHCDTVLTMKYIKLKGPRCPRCKKSYKEAAKSLTEHFAKTGEEKAVKVLEKLKKNIPLRLKLNRLRLRQRRR